MAYTATVIMLNGPTLTGTGLTIQNGVVWVTGASGLNAIAAAGGMPTGVHNNAQNSPGHLTADTTFSVPVDRVAKITVA